MEYKEPVLQVINYGRNLTTKTTQRVYTCGHCGQPFGYLKTSIRNYCPECGTPTRPKVTKKEKK